MPGRRVDHAVANDERRQPFGAGAAQDAQHVVLLHGDARRGATTCAKWRSMSAAVLRMLTATSAFTEWKGRR